MTTVSYREFRLRCPYGKWTCADGREVIFNREYWPILSRGPGEKAKPADPNEWVQWKEQDFYFDDGNSPWQRRQRVAAHTLARCNRALAEWGFPALPKPSLRKALSGDLTDQPRVNPYGPAADTAEHLFADIHRRRRKAGG